MTFTLPKNTRILWQCRAACVLAVLCAVLVAFCRFSIWFILPTTIVFAVGSVFVFAFIPLWFKNYEVVLNDDTVCIIKGVIFKTTIIVPNLRIAFVKTFTTPIASWLKLNCIILKVARCWIFIPEIDERTTKILVGTMQNE